MTVELAPPPPATERKPARQDEYDPRWVCHLRVDPRVTLCGRRCGENLSSISVKEPESVSDPCSCGCPRCPRCKAIWSE